VGTISTFGELKAAISDYSGRNESRYIANRGLFVMRAHVVLMRDLRIPLLQATADLPLNAEKVTPPGDFRAVASLYLDDNMSNPLSPTSMELRVKEARANPAGRPRVFSIEGSQIAFGPVPGAGYVGKLLYHRTLPFFADDSATNDLLARHPFAYLYGAMAEGARFDKFPEDEASFEAMFRSEIAEIQAEALGDTTRGGSLQMIVSGGV
jgi:hypothetical protein